MPNLNAITTIINTSLQTGQFASRRFAPSQYYGVADPVKITGEEVERFEPMMIDDDGECTSLMYDDTNAIQIFHEKENPVYEVAPVDYGKPGTTMRETIGMKLIFFGNRARIKTDEINCAAAIAMDFPKELTTAQLTSLQCNYGVIEMGDVETNPYTVWDQEFPGTQFGLLPNTILISVKYKLTLEYNKGCFSICN